MSIKLTPVLRAKIENTIRVLSIDAVERAGCGHPGAPMGLARPAFELWAHHLRFDPTDPNWSLRDRFVLSAGHASMLLYSLLHLFGFDLQMEDLINFRQLGSRTPGHPEYGETPGVEVTTGPLGQGFGHGVGMALAGRLARARFGCSGKGPGYHRVYGIVSDGDLMEGVCYESASLAGHLGLGNLIYLYDDNRITIDGPTALSFSEDVEARFEAQRWHVLSVDGEDVSGLAVALEAACTEAERPSLLIVKTTIGHGSPNRAGRSKAHGEALGKEETSLTKEALGWPAEPDFHVPQDVKDYLTGVIETKKAERRESDIDLDAWRTANIELANAWDAVRRQAIPEGLDELLIAGLAGVDGATRKHSGEVIQRLTDHAPFLVGGSADLAGSNNTAIKDAGDVGPAVNGGLDPFAGSNLHFGVREHAMGAVTNGICLDGTFRAYAGTFLVFSDYMRPSIRLAALMGVPSIYIFTHDSIFLGEDGPTHQPIEHLDALRAIPGLNVFRPADGIEVAMTWSWIVQHAKGPSLLALTRQTVQALKRDNSFRNQDVWHGAYLLSDSAAKPAVILVASGSEVSLISLAGDLLKKEGIEVRLVSAPCLELFEKQDKSYREALLPGGVPIVAVEAAKGEAYHRVIGDYGLVYGIDRFGASAPAEDLRHHFGFTPKALAHRVREYLRRS